MKNVVLQSSVEGSTAIIFIVKEGSTVKNGDLVCELDSSALLNREIQQQIAVEKAKSALRQGEEDLKIQELTNTSEIDAADLKLQLAEIDLVKFQEGELVQQKNDLENQLLLADQNLSKSQESYDYVKRLVKSGYKMQSDLESERLAVEAQRINKELIEGRKKLLLDFTERRSVIELKARVEESQREKERTDSRTKAAMVQREAALFERKLVFNVESKLLERLAKQIASCKIYATLDGQVVYANIKDGRATEQVMIDEGVLVRERQAIINIPDLSQMKVNARIHESRISLVRPGMSVQIKTDSYPDHLFNGFVEQVASVPSSTGGFGGSGVKEYEAAVKITDDFTSEFKLRPGSSASCEILVERRDDVLQIPVIANVTIGSKQFVFVVKDKKVEQRAIKVGKTNSNYIEVLEGIVEGEEVVMNPHSHFQKEIAEIEEQTAAEQAKEAAKSPEVLAPSGPPASATQGPNLTGTGDKPAGMGAGRQGRPAGEGGPQGGGGGGPEGGRPDPMARFNQMDKDQNGKISKDEAEGRFAEAFDTFDTDADGSVTKEEFLAGRAKFGGRGGGGGGRPRSAEAGGN